MQENNKRIAKNTLFLYIRMIIVMGVSLYTSRVILDKMGIDDFGLYNVVGGVVGLLSFISGTLSIGTLRFLTVELGRKDYAGLHVTFNTTFYTHLLVGLVLAFLLETGGLWFVYHKLVIPEGRLSAALIAYHISVFTSIINMSLVPYTSLIMAHERMGIYAYISIFETFAKLLVVYLLSISDYDKLIVYAVLIALVQILVSLIYYVYCNHNFVESRLGIIFKKETFKLLLNFSGWNILANVAETLKLQGYLVLINMFFQPFVVTAQAIGNQVAGAMMQFINNFRTAINPQIIKLYAAGDYEGSKRLTFNTTILVFDLVMLLGLPTIFVLDTIMRLWLVEVPPYAVLFTQYIIVQRILSTFDAAFYIPMMAAGKIKTNSILASIFGPGSFFILYIVFELGGDVMWLQYIGVIGMAIYSFFVKPYIVVHDKIEGYSFRDFIPCTLTCLKVAVLSVSLSYLAYLLLGNTTIISSMLLFLVSMGSVLVASYLFLDSYMKMWVRERTGLMFVKLRNMI